MDATSKAAVIAGLFLFGQEVLKFLFSLINKDGFRKKMSKALSDSTDKDIKIKQELRNLIERYDFDRVSVIEYHNGITTLAGVSLKKASMTHEETNTRTASMLNEFQSVPCSISASMLKELENTHDGYVCVDDESAVEETAIANRMYGVRQAWNFRIGNLLIDGCLSCVYTEETRYFEHEEILDIKASAKKILLIKSKK